MYQKAGIRIFSHWLENLSPAIKLYRCKVFSFSIKSSCFFQWGVAKSLSMSILSSCLIKVNLACWLKLWLDSLKCWWSACCTFCLLISLQWLFNWMLNSFSDFSFYWIRQIIHYLRYFLRYYLRYFKLFHN